MPKYFKSSTKGLNPILGNNYTDDYAVIGDSKNRRVPLGTVTARIREEKTSTNDFTSNNKDEQPTELFTTTPKSVEITEASVDPSLKSSFLTIGAMIHKEHGVPLTASDDLSKWSSAVSRNAQKKGLPIIGHERNPNMEQTNEIGGQHSIRPNQLEADYAEDTMEGYSAIPAHEVTAARQHLRNLLGHPVKDTKQHLSSQFSNRQLPGMENY